MGRIIKALILGWIGKKIFDRVTERGEREKLAAEATEKPAQPAAHARSSAPRRTARKTAHRAA